MTSFLAYSDGLNGWGVALTARLPILLFIVVGYRRNYCGCPGYYGLSYPLISSVSRDNNVLQYIMGMDVSRIPLIRNIRIS